MSRMIACHQCDTVQRLPQITDSGVVRCARCGAVLYRKKKNSLDRTLALAITGLIVFCLANSFPFLFMQSDSNVQETTLLSGIRELYAQDMWPVALLVLLTTIAVPLAQLLVILYLLVPFKLNHRPRFTAPALRFLQAIKPWGMLEVMMLGILVSIVKLSDSADIIPGISLYAFMVLIFIMAAIAATFDPHAIWERLEFDR